MYAGWAGEGMWAVTGMKSDEQQEDCILFFHFYPEGLTWLDSWEIIEFEFIFYTIVH